MKAFVEAIGSAFGTGRLIALAALVALIGLRVWDPAVLEALRLRSFDFYQLLEPRSTDQKLPVAIIDIDEKSLSELGQWPWPRTVVAQMLASAANAGAVAVAFDIVFAEPDRLSPGMFASGLQSLSEATKREMAALPNNDEVLASVIRQMRVVVGQAGRIDLESSDRTPQAQTPVAVLGADPKPFLRDYPQLLRNIDVIEDAAAGKGLFSIFPDLDSIVRRVGLVSLVEDRIQPTLSVELLRVATGQNAFAVKSDEAGITSVVVGGVEVPTDRNGRLWVYYSPHDKARYVSAADLIAGRVDPGRLQGHLVFVGTSATGLLDIKATPIEPAMPGVEIHAQLLETILSKTYLTRPNYALGAELVTTAVISLLIIYLVPVLGALPVLALGFVVAAAVGSGSWYLFISERMLFDVVYPLVTSFSIFLILIFLNYRREELRRKEIRSAFSQYLAPDYVEQIVENPDALSLGGEVRQMTFLFSDVRGFTTISESFKGNPQGLTALMNRFLTPLSNAIMARKGTIDKYMGDAIMAFWNAPIEDLDQERNACFVALEMVKSLDAVNDERKREAEAAGEPFQRLNVGIGINTGECVVGNMGSDVRFDYSVLGDAVNLASRLEGQSKSYGVTIILGEQTATKVQDDFAIVEIDLIKVKGKDEPVRIYCLMGGEDLAGEQHFVEAKHRFSEALAAYRKQSWDLAEKTMQDLLSADLKDFAGLAATYVERIGAYRELDLPDTWDGVFVATSK